MEGDEVIIDTDVLPMGEMSAACARVLRRERRPIKYTVLTEMAMTDAVARGGLGYSKDDVERMKLTPSHKRGRKRSVWDDQIEDVREKWAEAGHRSGSVFYVGKEYGSLAACRDWFDTTQLALNGDEPVQIASSVNASIAGGHEALMRSPTMIVKWAPTKDDLMRARVRGLVIQHHVSRWFAAKWPGLYRPAENDGEWEQWCGHDFRLLLPTGKLIGVDVAGKSAHHGWDPMPQKPKTDIHLCCQVDEDRDVVTWVGFEKRYDYAGHILDAYMTSPSRMIVWLNCLADPAIDYGRLREAAAG